MAAGSCGTQRTRREAGESGEDSAVPLSFDMKMFPPVAQVDFKKKKKSDCFLTLISRNNTRLRPQP